MLTNTETTPMAGDQYLEIDLLRRKATFGQIVLNLTPREVSLLYVLHSEGGGPVSREKLCTACDISCEDRSLHNHIHRLRTKLHCTGYQVVPVRSVGYRLTYDPSAIQ